MRWRCFSKKLKLFEFEKISKHMKIFFCFQGTFSWACNKAGQEIGVECDAMVGYHAVYRVCFAMTVFFVLFAVLMINVRTSRDGRSKIQNGFWFFKYLILIGIMVGAFYFPQDFSDGIMFNWIHYLNFSLDAILNFY